MRFAALPGEIGRRCPRSCTSYLARRDHEMGQSGENLGHEGEMSQRAIVLKRIACVRALLQLSRIGL